MSRLKLLVAFALVVMTAAAFSQGQPPGDRLTAGVFNSFALRSIGPTLTTGRVADFDVDPKNPSVYWVATAAGGLWKSTNKGIDFTPVWALWNTSQTPAHDAWCFFSHARHCRRFRTSSVTSSVVMLAGAALLLSPIASTMQPIYGSDCLRVRLN